MRIGVLGIFHSQHLTIASSKDEDLVLSAGAQQLFLHSRSSCATAELTAANNLVVTRCGRAEFRAATLRAASRNQQATRFVLGIPGKINRRYDGILEVHAKNGEIVPIVAMDLEVAVASIVQAEAMPGTPLEALKAQATISRSYLVAGRGRHVDFDFCDLTHCQFLREPPDATSLAAQAAAATRGLVLAYNGQPIAAMFTRSCGGDTRTPAEIGLPSAGYPYYGVRCEICHQNPIRWSRQLTRADAALLLGRGEQGRLAIDRRLGWNAVPSNNFTAREHGREVILQGAGQGHGVGLCQRGARGMAELGSDFKTILDHYFPNTTLKSLSSN